MKAIIYTTSWCTYCKEAKNYLKNKGVEVTEKDIEADEAAKDEMLEKIGFFQGVPVIEIGETLMNGFDPKQIDLALES